MHLADPRFRMMRRAVVPSKKVGQVSMPASDAVRAMSFAGSIPRIPGKKPEIFGHRLSVLLEMTDKAGRSARNINIVFKRVDGSTTSASCKWPHRSHNRRSKGNSDCCSLVTATNAFAGGVGVSERTLVMSRLAHSRQSFRGLQETVATPTKTQPAIGRMRTTSAS